MPRDGHEFPIVLICWREVVPVPRQSKVQSRPLDVAPAAATHFQYLGGMSLSGNAWLHTTAQQIEAGEKRQPGLWPLGIGAKVRIGESHVSITIDNPGRTGNGIRSATLNGKVKDLDHGRVRMRPAHGEHRLVVTLYGQTPAPR